MRADALTTEPHRPGLLLFFKYHYTFMDLYKCSCSVNLSYIFETFYYEKFKHTQKVTQFYSEYMPVYTP